MRGIRRRLKSVREVKMISGFCLWPIPAYVRKAITVASIGSDICARKKVRASYGTGGRKPTHGDRRVSSAA